MRILVVSDSHGSAYGLRRAIMAQPKAEVVIHLGDGEDDVARVKHQFPEKMFLSVKGNCDLGSQLPPTGEFTVEGVKIFYTHGHLYGVKSGQYTIVCAAREKGAQVLLYGHTQWVWRLLWNSGYHPPGDCDQRGKTSVRSLVSS